MELHGPGLTTWCFLCFLCCWTNKSRLDCPLSPLPTCTVILWGLYKVDCLAQTGLGSRVSNWQA